MSLDWKWLKRKDNCFGKWKERYREQVLFFVIDSGKTARRRPLIDYCTTEVNGEKDWEIISKIWERNPW